MKKLDGGRPETPFVLTAWKLYTHMNGDKNSMCYKMMYGNETSSLRNSKDVDHFEIHVPADKEIKPEQELDFI